MIRKSGIAFPIGIDINPDRAIDAANIVITYVKSGTLYAPVTVNGTFYHDANGLYRKMVSIDEPGYFDIDVTIPASNDYSEVNGTGYPAEKISQSIYIANATVDDVYSYLTDLGINLGIKIDSVKSQVDVLDEATLNNLNDKVINIQAKLETVTALINDENNDGILSLKELLAELSTSGSNNAITAINGYIDAATDDIERMVAGTETLADGTPNPFFGKTTHDIYDGLVGLGAALADADTFMKTLIENKITEAKVEINGKIDTVTAIINANQDLLENETYGLSKIMESLTTLRTSESNNFTSLKDDLTALYTDITSLGSVINGKLDNIQSSINVLNNKVRRTSSTKIF